MKVFNVLETLRKDGFNVEAVEVRKNGVVLNGIRFFPEGSNVSPTVYIDGFDTEEEAVDACERLFKQPVPEIKNPFEDFDESRLHARVYAEGKSGSDLTRKLNDLEIVASYTVNVNGSTGSININRSYLQEIGLTADEVIDLAIANTIKETEVFEIGDLLNRLAGKDLELPESAPMMVLTTASQYHGAATILNTEALRGIADKLESDLFILPSSIHEIIVVPTSLGDVEPLREMVETINQTEVEATDRLSDTVYRFNRKDNTVTIA